MDSEASIDDAASISEDCVLRILNCLLSCVLVLLLVVVISGIGEYVVVVDVDRRVGASITIAMTIEHMICAQHIIKTM